MNTRRSKGLTQSMHQVRDRACTATEWMAGTQPSSTTPLTHTHAHPQTHPVLPGLGWLADHLWRLWDKTVPPRTTVPTLAKHQLLSDPGSRTDVSHGQWLCSCYESVFFAAVGYDQKLRQKQHGKEKKKSYSYVKQKPDVGPSGLKSKCQQGCTVLKALGKSLLIFFSISRLPAVLGSPLPSLSKTSSGGLSHSHSKSLQFIFSLPLLLFKDLGGYFGPSR